jgi:hypothetical protein
MMAAKERKERRDSLLFVFLAFFRGKNLRKKTKLFRGKYMLTVAVLVRVVRVVRGL